ncbi:MAG: hypothetical protein HQ498_12145 [Pseudohongiella sp.]|nr:hypothetical protein [Pseudohongiella sp.]
MGLHIHSLGNVSISDNRDYFVYMLDYGWHEPLAEAMRENFTNMARLASKTNSIVVAGVEPIHFENEVFSFHGINGEDGDKILPALLVTTLHPNYFNKHKHQIRESGEIDDKLLLVPLKECCKTTSDVVSLIHRIFSDIEKKKKLTDFEVSKKLRKSGYKAMFDAVILKPSIAGVGVDIKKLLGANT